MDGNWFAKLTGAALLSMRSVHKMIIIIEWNLSGAHVGGTDCHVNKGKFFFRFANLLSRETIFSFYHPNADYIVDAIDRS